MRFERPIINFLVATKRRKERLAEIGMIQNRAESDVQNLARMEVVEQRRELVVGQARRVRGLGDFGGDVIAGAVNRVAFAREGGYLAEEFRIDLSDGPQGFEVTGAGGLQMDEFARQARGDRID